jgi:hypothetical protein
LVTQLICRLYSRDILVLILEQKGPWSHKLNKRLPLDIESSANSLVSSLEGILVRMEILL